jgi:acetyltransferase
MHRIWTAADGTPVVIRPIAPGDLSLTEKFDSELSPQSKYRRLLSDRRLSSAELRRFTHIDPRREIALIGIVGDPGDLKQVGVARCVADDAGQSAEFAIVVSDDWQQRGLGAVLLSALIDAARLRGMLRIEAITMADNRGMLNLARKLGFSARPDPDEPKLIELVLSLV